PGRLVGAAQTGVRSCIRARTEYAIARVDPGRGTVGGLLRRRGGRLPRRRARPRRRLLRRVLGRTPRGPARRGRHLRRARRARRPPRRGARGRDLLRAQQAGAVRPVSSRRRRRRHRLVRLARRGLQAADARPRRRRDLTLSEDLRDELAAIAPRRRCCRLAELSALFHTAGVWHLHGRGELAVHLDLASGHAARRAFTLLRELRVHSEIRTYRRHAFANATRYQLHTDVDLRTRDVLREAGVLPARGAPLERPPKSVVGRSCCRAAYLRGALLGGGSLSGPRAPHLELRASGIDGARLLAEIATREGLTLRTAER